MKNTAKKVLDKITGFIKKHKFLSVIIAAALVLAIILMSGRVGGAAPDTVDTVALQRMDLQKLVAAVGDIKSSESRPVSVAATTEVTKIYVKAGDLVERGELLAQLDTADLDRQISSAQNSLDSAQAKLNDAQAAYKSASDAYDNANPAQKQADVEAAAQNLQGATDALAAAMAAGNPSDIAAAQLAADNAKKAYDTASAAYASIAELAAKKQSAYATVSQLSEALAAPRNQLDTLNVQRAKCFIKAPISGTVTSVGAQVGGMPVGASPMFVIADLTRLQIDVKVPEYDLTSVKLGQKAEIRSDADTGSVWQGVVKSISPVAVDTDHNFSVTVEITGSLGILTAGMSAKVNIICEQKNNVFAVPYDAVVKDAQGNQVVYVLERPAAVPDSAVKASAPDEPTDTRRAIKVQTGLESDYYIEIISLELAEDMQIVSDPENRNVSSNAFDNGIFSVSRG